MLNFLKLMISQSGEVSTMRMMSIASLLIGAGISVYGVVANRDLGDIALLAGVFVGAAFGGKAWQKIAESKTSNLPPES